MLAKIGVLVALLFTSASVIWPQPLALTAEEAVERALTQNARLAVRAAELTAAQEDAEAAGRPEPIRLSLSPATIWNEFEAGVSAVLGISGKRKWASRAARHELAATVAGNEEFRLELVASVRSAYWHLRAAQELQTIAKEQVKVAEALHQAAGRVAQEGLGKRIDVDRAASALQQARLQQREAEAAVRKGQTELASLLFMPPETLVTATDSVPGAHRSVPPTSDLQDLALKSRPAMQRVAALAGAALARAGIAGAERNPDLEVALERDDEDQVNFGRALLELPLIDFGTIKHGKRAAKARAEAALAEVDVVEAEVRQEVQSALDSLVAARAIEPPLGEELIPRQEDIVARLQRGYEARAVSYLDVLEAQTTLNELRGRWLDAVTDRLDAQVRLERAIGVPLEGIDNADRDQ